MNQLDFTTEILLSMFLPYCVYMILCISYYLFYLNERESVLLESESILFESESI